MGVLGFGDLGLVRIWGFQGLGVGGFGFQSSGCWANLFQWGVKAFLTFGRILEV